MNDIKQQLYSKRRQIFEEIKKIGPWVEGTLVCVKRICGTKTCSCRQGGPKHPAMFITGKNRGRTICLYIPRKLEKDVMQWSRNYKKLKEYIKALSDIQKQIIRLRD